MKTFMEIYAEEFATIDCDSKVYRRSVRKWYEQGGEICIKGRNSLEDISNSTTYSKKNGNSVSWNWSQLDYIPVIAEYKTVPFTWDTILKEGKERLSQLGITCIFFKEGDNTPLIINGDCYSFQRAADELDIGRKIRQLIRRAF